MIMRHTDDRLQCFMCPYGGLTALRVIDREINLKYLHISITGNKVTERTGQTRFS